MPHGEEGPEPTGEEIRDALETAWSMVRISWESDPRDEEASKALDAQLAEMARQHRPNDLFHALVIVGARLAMDLEHAYVHVMGPEQAREATRRLLWQARGWTSGLAEP